MVAPSLRSRLRTHMSGCVAAPNKRGEPLNDVSFFGEDEKLTAYYHSEKNFNGNRGKASIRFG